MLNFFIFFQPKITLPSDTALQAISQYIIGLQTVDSPLDKLEHLLSAIALIFNSVSFIKFYLII